MKLAVVTATLDMERARPCFLSWHAAVDTLTFYVIVQGAGTLTLDAEEAGRRIRVIAVPEILGVVPAFALGVQKALEDGADIIACLHDDLLIEQDGWDETVRDHFTTHPRCGLVGFGGGKGLGSSDLYNVPYHPMQLARQDFISNMRDAEAHGRRVTTAERVACLDGFSLIGRAAFWTGNNTGGPNYFQYMHTLGLVHHCYDSAAGAWAKRHGWEVWMLPVKVHHFGGRTAVADARYAEWARQQTPGGDADFWERAHKICYAEFRAELPIRVPR